MKAAIHYLQALLLALCIGTLAGCAAHTPAIVDAVGKPLPQGIAELEPVTLGGARQWLLIRGADRKLPVLLFLHGGPGSAYIGLSHAFQRQLEQHFVVVQWDQRGSGKSYPDTAPASMMVEQMLADTHELVMLLRQRLQREKIYLLGHSWGSYLGLIEAERHPENLYAYIGTGQMIDLQQQERQSHAYVRERALGDGNREALRQLDEIGTPPYRDIVAGMERKYEWLWHYGGMLENETGPAPFVRALLGATEYSWLDIVSFIRGGSFSLRQMATNEGERFWRLQAPDPAVGLQLPVFFISGAQDKVTPPALVANYYTRLQAPMKHAWTIDGVGHFAFFTAQDRFAAAMLEVLQRTQPGHGVASRIASIAANGRE